MGLPYNRSDYRQKQMLKNRVSDNVVPVKYFLGVLTRAITLIIPPDWVNACSRVVTTIDQSGIRRGQELINEGREGFLRLMQRS